MAVVLTEAPRSRGAATLAALQPVEVLMSTRADGRDVITIRRTLVDLGQVGAMSVLTRGDLLDGLECRRRLIIGGKKPRPHHLPRPARDSPGDAQWEQPGLVTWLWRMGLHTEGHRGVPLIGYLGLSMLTGLTERQLIDRAALRHDPARARDLPLSVLDIGTGPKVMALFDRRAAIQWAVWTELLRPGVDVDRALRATVTRP